ncbi:tol-pal system protein YbgF [Blochmannia endosymbiont of Camponotus (Colobopsis) obliquus]|uniref:tol-pal system protein YbgF n=1 Tax=Blochmannia endosymbiont of Camponotus (Colobopsis) obliquus TaxID=1505597 RepID=UPI00130E5B3C|nr:tol-pal system protein YbgF [Blochmannia endosymbiont of Camponotus (Colobopsis) obliquus]
MISYSLSAKIAVSKINNIDPYEEKILQAERIYNAHSRCLIKLQQQLLDLQEDIDHLRGQIQENKYQLTQLLDKQIFICQQINDLMNNNKILHIYDNKCSSVNDKVTPSKSVVHSSKNNVDKDYNEALSLIFKKKKYDQAIIAFQDFVRKYPDSIYQPNAHYWLGQLNYNKKKQDAASYHFAVVAKKYPKSSKAPDALLKIGIIMQNKGYKDKAKAIYYQVGKLYPNSDAARQVKKFLARL